MRHTVKWITLPLKEQIERDSFNENHDCTVVALAAAADIPYREAHAILAKAGRRPRKGFKFRLWLDNQCFMARMKNRDVVFGNYRVQRVRMDWPVTLAKVLRDFPRGRFIARKRSHVFVVNDGQVLNLWQGVRTRITNLWYFEAIS